MIGTKKAIAVIVGLLMVCSIGFGLLKFLVAPAPVKEEVKNPTPKFLNSASFVCASGVMFEASFLEDLALAATSTPPPPPGILRVSFADGKNLELKQTISAGGARYANADESTVYWNKGNAMYIEENGAESDYKNCLMLTPVSPGVRLPVPFVASNGTFLIRLPSIAKEGADGYRVDEAFSNQISPDRIIPGVQFIIPESVATGTNLSSNTYLSIEHISLTEATSTCDAALFFDGEHATTTLVEANQTYVVASSSNAGAGNRYDEFVYALQSGNECVGVRYKHHHMALENYASGTVREADISGLITSFDQIRGSITLNF